METMVAAEIEKWWAVMRADSQKSVQMCGEYRWWPEVALPSKEFFRKPYSAARKKSSLAARRKGVGMNAALLRHLSMKLDSLILRRALKKRSTE